MEHLIRFRSLAASMSTAEIKQMMSDVIQQDNDATEVINAMWNYGFLQYKNNDFLFVNKLNDVASDIKRRRNDAYGHDNTQNSERVDDREQSPQQQSCPVTRCITCMPAAVINNIGRYLELIDLAAMECVNRFFFVSLRYPSPALQYLPASIEGDQWTTHYVNHCRNTNIPIRFDRFRSLQYLFLCGPDSVADFAFFGNSFRSIADIALEMSIKQVQEAFQSTLDPHIITALDLYIWRDKRLCDDAASIFKKFLNSLRNLLRLTLNLMEIDQASPFQSDFKAIIDAEQCPVLPNLIVLEAKGHTRGIIDTILNAISSKLQSLSLLDVTYNDLVAYSQSKQLQHLQEFVCSGAPAELDLFLDGPGLQWSTFPNLRRLHLRLLLDDSAFDDVDVDEQLQSIIPKILENFSKNTNLEYVGIELHSFNYHADWMNFQETMGTALRNYRGKTLTLIIELKDYSLHKMSLLRLVKCMKASTANYFCLVLRCYRVPKPELEIVDGILDIADVMYGENYVSIRAKEFEEPQWLHAPVHLK